jgi:hypothetical protein
MIWKSISVRIENMSTTSSPCVDLQILKLQGSTTNYEQQAIHSPSVHSLLCWSALHWSYNITTWGER